MGSSRLDLNHHSDLKMRLLGLILCATDVVLDDKDVQTLSRFISLNLGIFKAILWTYATYIGESHISALISSLLIPFLIMMNTLNTEFY